MKEGTSKAVGVLKLILARIRKASGRWYLVNGDGFNHYFTGLDKNGVDVLLELLDKLPAAEECLMRGGMVRDADGRWCSHGDRVRFKYPTGEWEHGELYYDDADQMWHIITDDSVGGAWFRLGANWEEVCQWVYEGEDNDCV